MPSLTGAPEEYSADPDEGTANFTANLEHWDLDYCVQGTPCIEEDPYSVTQLTPWYTYTWSDGITNTAPATNNSFTSEYAVPRSQGMQIRTITVGVNDVHDQPGEICENIADDGTKTGSHKLVLYRPSEVPSLSNPTYKGEWVHEYWPEEAGGHVYVVRYSFIEAWFEWKEVDGLVGNSLPDYTGCNCYYSAVTYTYAENLKVTNNFSVQFAPPALSKIGLSFRYSLNVEESKSLGGGIVLNCESPYINTKFTLIQETFRIKELRHEWLCDNPGPWLGYFYLCSDPIYYLDRDPWPSTFDVEGGADVLEVKKTRTCCN